MKKFVSFTLSMVFILGLVGCSSKSYELPHDQFCYAYESPTDRTREVELRKADKNYIVDLLNEGSWIDDLSNCGSDFVFYTQKQEVRYHSECGTFNDVTNKKSMTVSKEQRTTINAFLGIS